MSAVLSVGVLAESNALLGFSGAMHCISSTIIATHGAGNCELVPAVLFPLVSRLSPFWIAEMGIGRRDIVPVVSDDFLVSE